MLLENLPVFSNLEVIRKLPELLVLDRVLGTSANDGSGIPKCRGREWITATEWSIVVLEFTVQILHGTQGSEERRHRTL
jgi:hypothetical protein